MSQIIFEKVDRQSAASQGEPYSNKSGYQIWTREGSEDSEMIFLGFIFEDDFDNVVAKYQSEGNCELFIMRKQHASE